VVLVLVAIKPGQRFVELGPVRIILDPALEEIFPSAKYSRAAFSGAPVAADEIVHRRRAAFQAMSTRPCPKIKWRAAARS